MPRLIRDIYEHRELLQIMILRNIKIRYKGSALGFFWTLLGPIFMILIYAVFLRILRVPISLPVLITGIIVWHFLAMCLGDSLNTILGNSNLIKKTAFPRIILPLSMVVANAINFILSLAVLMVYLGLAHVSFGNLAWLPLILLTHLGLCVGVSLILSAANVFFRDTEHGMQVAMLGWFFLTPIIYPLSLPMEILRERFPEVLQYVYFANPMTGIVTLYRSALLSDETPDARLVALSVAVGWIVLAAGIAVFQRVQARFADEL